MTTARTRRSGTTAGPREGTTARPAGTTNEAIPVLIRLPRLAAEPEPSENDDAPEDAAGIRATIPLQSRAPEVEASSPVPDDARKAYATLSVMPTATAFQMPALTSNLSYWPRFRFSRRAINAVVALSLIAVLIAAFLAIKGPSEKSDKVADFEAAGTLPMPGIPATDVPPLPLSMPAMPPAPPPAPTARMTPAADAAATAPAAPANDVPGIAKQENAAAEKTAAPAAESQSADGNASPAVADPQSPLPPLPESPATPPATDSADRTTASPVAAGSPATAERKAEEAARTDSNLPLTTESALTEPPAPADRSTYPETNPTTFQYPVDYHLRLPSQTRAPAREIDGMGTGGPVFNGPTGGEAAANGWQPNTARLQPRIQPPPVR